MVRRRIIGRVSMVIVIGILALSLYRDKAALVSTAPEKLVEDSLHMGAAAVERVPVIPLGGNEIRDITEKSEEKNKPAIFRDAKLLTEEETFPDENGLSTRIQLLQTKFKYPLVRVVDRRKWDITSGDTLIVERVAMVADHVMVQKKSGVSDVEFADVVRRLGGEIKKEVNEDGLFVVSFDGRNAHALDRMVEGLNKSGVSAEAEPDYIRFTR